MNNTYKVIWSAAIQGWVTVSELVSAKGKQKRLTKRKVLLSSLCFGALVASGQAVAVDLVGPVAGPHTFADGDAVTLAIDSSKTPTPGSNPTPIPAIISDGAASHIASTGRLTIKINNQGTLGNSANSIIANGHGIYVTNGGSFNSDGFINIVTNNGVGLFSDQTGSQTNIVDAYIETGGYFGTGIQVDGGSSFSSTGLMTIHTTGDRGAAIRVTGGSRISIKDANLTADKDEGILILQKSSLTSTGTINIKATTYGIRSFASDESLDVNNLNIVSNGVGMRLSGDSFSSSGKVSINSVQAGIDSILTANFNELEITTTGVQANGINLRGGFNNHRYSFISRGATTITTHGNGSHGIYVIDFFPTIFKLGAGSSITTTGDGADGIYFHAGFTGATYHAPVLTFDATNVLPRITVMGRDSSLINLHSTTSKIGQILNLRDQTFDMSQTAGPNTWGIKSGWLVNVNFLGNSNTGGVGLWVTSGNGQITLSDQAVADGSRVRIDKTMLGGRPVAGKFIIARPDRMASIGSLEGDGALSFTTAGGTLTIGKNNASNNGSMVDNANFSGTLTNVASLIKTGAFNQILSGVNTVNSVDVQAGRLSFAQTNAAFTVAGNYTTQTGASTDVGHNNSTLRINGIFTQRAGSTLNITLNTNNTIPSIFANSAYLDGILNVNPNTASAADGRDFVLIRTTNGITNDFSSQQGACAGLNYIRYNCRISGNDYLLSYSLAWSSGGQSNGTGDFDVAPQQSFTYDQALTNQTVPAGGFASGWDGQSLTKNGAGTLILAAANTYTGRTTVNAGTLRTDIDNSFVASSDVVINGGTLDLNGTNQQANRLAGSQGGNILLNGAALTVNNATDADSSTYAGDINDGSRAGQLIKQGSGSLTLKGAQLSHITTTRLNEGRLILDGSNGGSWLSNIIAASGTRLTLQHGAVFAGSIDPTDVDIDASSVWKITDNSTNNALPSVIKDLSLAGTILFDAPAAGASPTHTLTVNNWTGNGGTVELYSVLGNDASATNKIVIDGANATATATGNTALLIHNSGAGTGAQTNQGILLVDAQNGAKTDATAFHLSPRSDGYRASRDSIVAGLYDYRLVRGGNHGQSESWYLVSQPGYRPETGVYLNNKLATLTMQMHSLHDRQGASGSVNGAWIRLGSNSNQRAGAGGQILSDASTFVHAGVDLLKVAGAHNGIFKFGLMGQYSVGRNKSEIDGERANGDVTGYSLGLYGTWYGDKSGYQGWYVDSWLMSGQFNNGVNGEGLARESYKSKEISTSLEMGYTFPVYDSAALKLSIVPQTQLSRINYQANAHAEQNGTLVSKQSDGSTVSRLGIRVNASVFTRRGREIDMFAQANWRYGPDTQSIAFNGERFYDALPADRMEGKAGLQWKVNKLLSLAGTVGIESGSNTAQIGIRRVW